MNIKKVIEDNLMNYLKALYRGEEKLYNAIEQYNKENFKEALEKAIMMVSQISNFETENIFENIHDYKPVKNGVILGRKNIFSKRANKRLLFTPTEGDEQFPDFVYDWGTEALQSSYFSDILCQIAKFPKGTIDEDGYLSGFEFEVSVNEGILITISYEVIPIITERIYFRFADGEEFDLYKHNLLGRTVRSDRDINEVFGLIFGMENVLKRRK